MRFLVVGGSGRIGARVVSRLSRDRHEVVVASRRHGVDAVTGEGLLEAMQGADAVIDVSRPSSYEPDEVMAFFTRGTEHQLAAEDATGVSHHVALSVVGARELAAAGSAFMQAKAAQENLIRRSRRPATVVAATQFFEFFDAIADHADHDGEVRLPAIDVQPIAADDVAGILAHIAREPPRRLVEATGPQRMPIAEFVAIGLASVGDVRRVVTDPSATYFGADVAGSQPLVPGPDAVRGTTQLRDWIAARG